MRLFILFLGLIVINGPSQAREIQDLSVEEIEELILTEVYPIFTGDDGIECEAEIVSLFILSRIGNEISAQVVARQDEGRHGCGPETIRCDVKLTHDPARGWGTSFSCE